MASMISYIMASAGLALLLVYGADVAASGEDGDGFIPLDSQTRGMAFGAPPIALSIAAFVVSRNRLSIPLGGMIIATGILVIIGGIAAAQFASQETAQMGGSSIALIGIGAFIAGLGGIACVKSR